MASGDKWWSKDTLAVVTGGNKGIGYEVVKQLAEKGVSVIIAARDEARVSEAAKALASTGLKVTSHVLDVGNKQSIRDFVAWLKEEHGGLDILVNNAAAYSLTLEDAEQNIGVNYWGLALLTRELLPLLRDGGKILNVSSGYGRLQLQNNVEWRKKLADSNLVQETVDAFVLEYLKAVKARATAEEWSPPYHASKLAVNGFTRVLAKDPALNSRNITVNAVHPGVVKTDLNPYGEIAPEEGADTIVWAALLPPGGPTGHFFYLRKEFGW